MDQSPQLKPKIEKSLTEEELAYVEAVKKEWETMVSTLTWFPFIGVRLEAWLPGQGDERNAKLDLLKEKLPEILGPKLEYRIESSGFRIFERNQTFGQGKKTST